jgi:GST-like protein
VIDIMGGVQFSSGFVSVNPNSKIPAALDLDGPGGQPLELFESASILLYLAEKYHRFIPENPADRARVMNWLFWQMSGFGPIPGNFGHFMVYAPDDQVDARKYGLMRFGMEVQRLCSVLDTHLKGRTYMVGEEYTIADMAIFPWFQQLRNGTSCALHPFFSIST